MTLDSGVRLETKLSITPKQKNPKLIQSSKSVVLVESARGSEYGADFLIETAEEQVGEIKSIKLYSSSDTFAYSEGRLYVKETATLKPGQIYTIKLAVTYEDHARNLQPSYVNVKIDYRK